MKHHKNLMWKLFFSSVMLHAVIVTGIAQTYLEGDNSGGDGSIELCHQKYKVVKTYKYEFAPQDYEALTPFEKWRYRTRSKTNIESFDFDASGEMVYTIQHVADSGMYEDWMGKPLVKVFTSSGVTIQNSKMNIEGSYYNQYPLTEAQAVMFEILKEETRNFRNRIIVPPTQDELANSGEWSQEADGTWVNDLGDGGLRFITPDGKLFVYKEDPSCQCNSLSIYDHTITDSDIMTLTYEQTVCSSTLPNGTPYKMITKMEYSDWEVQACGNQPVQLRGRSISEEKNRFKVYPSVTSEKLFIELPHGVKVHEVEVLDKLGRIMPVTVNETEDKLILRVGHGMDNGLYYVRLRHDNGEELFKFILNK